MTYYQRGIPPLPDAVDGEQIIPADDAGDFTKVGHPVPKMMDSILGLAGSQGGILSGGLRCPHRSGATSGDSHSGQPRSIFGGLTEQGLSLTSPGEMADHCGQAH